MKRCRPPAAARHLHGERAGLLGVGASGGLSRPDAAAPGLAPEEAQVEAPGPGLDLRG